MPDKIFHKIRIAFFEIEEWEKDYFKNHLNGFETVFYPEVLSLDNVRSVKDCQIISIFIQSKINRDILLKLPQLKIIATRSTGVDHIDSDETERRNIAVCNVPEYGENTVAEHTFALILTLSRNLYKSIQGVKERGFGSDRLRGFDLKGKTLGVIGMGHIGRQVARIGQGFQMKVLAFDIREDKKMAKKLNFQYVPLEKLLKNSDIITLHLPFNEKTKHLINSSNVNSIKRGAYLINTARGGIIETEALVKGLNNGTLAGAGLDVLEEEHHIKEELELLAKGFLEKYDAKTMLESHVLMEQDNVIITPHNAFNSKEAAEKILETTVENIQSFIRGKTVNVIQ